jgi:hypothetical protein
MPSTRSNTKKLSKEDAAKAAHAVEVTASPRNPVPTGTGQPPALTTIVPEGTTEADAASPIPVQGRTDDTSSAPVVPLPEGKEPITGTGTLTGSHADDQSERSSRLEADYPNGSLSKEELGKPNKLQAVISVKLKAKGKESGQIPAEAGKRPKKRIPRWLSAWKKRKKPPRKRSSIENRKKRSGRRHRGRQRGRTGENPSAKS